jgi:hypothetical protein
VSSIPMECTLELLNIWFILQFAKRITPKFGNQVLLRGVGCIRSLGDFFASHHENM